MICKAKILCVIGLQIIVMWPNQTGTYHHVIITDDLLYVLLYQVNQARKEQWRLLCAPFSCFLSSAIALQRCLRWWPLRKWSSMLLSMQVKRRHLQNAINVMILALLLDTMALEIDSQTNYTLPCTYAISCYQLKLCLIYVSSAYSIAAPWDDATCVPWAYLVL